MQNLRPLTLGELLDAAFKIYRGRAKTLMLAVAVPMLPVLVLQTLITWSTQPDNYNPFDFNQASTATPDPGQALLQMTGALIGALLVIVGSSLATAACFRAVSDAYLGDSVTWRESLAFARTRIWSVIGLTILTSLATMLGLVGCIVGVLVPITWFAVAMPALLLEGVGPAAAMGRSRALTAGRFWPVLGAVLVAGLLASVLQGVLTAPAIALYFTDLPSVVAEGVQAVFSLVSLILVTPFTAAFTMALYVDLRVRREGFDLYLWAQKLGVDASGGFPDQPGHNPMAFGGFPAPGSHPPPPPPPIGGSDLPPPPPPPSGDAPYA
jgi:hypothetical protein